MVRCLHGSGEEGRGREEGKRKCLGFRVGYLERRLQRLNYLEKGVQIQEVG